MKNTKDNVSKFRKEFKIKGVPDLCTLKKVIMRMTYTLLPYDGNEALLAKLLEGRKIERRPSITISKGENKYIFYNSNISEEDLPYILAHEIAHIYFNHLNRKNGYFDTNEFKEREANEFASELLTKQHRSNISILILVVSLIVNIYALFPETNELKSFSEYVYITPSGDCYHTENCAFGKDYIRSIKVKREDVIDSYLPCAKCNADKY